MLQLSSLAWGFLCQDALRDPKDYMGLEDYLGLRDYIGLEVIGELGRPLGSLDIFPFLVL